MSRPSWSARGLDLWLVLSRLPAAAWLAIVLALAGLLAQCVWLPSLRRQRTELAEELRMLRHRRDVRSTGPSHVPATSLQRLKDFQAVLGGAEHQEVLTRVMFSAAGDAGLSLTEGSYARTVDRAGLYLRLDVSQPVRGTFAQTRSYCDRVLAAVPYAALEDLHFKRDGIAVPAGEALVRWTFYLRPDPARPQVDEAAR